MRASAAAAICSRFCEAAVSALLSLTLPEEPPSCLQRAEPQNTHVWTSKC